VQHTYPSPKHYAQSVAEPSQITFLCFGLAHSPELFLQVNLRWIAASYLALLKTGYKADSERRLSCRDEQSKNSSGGQGRVNEAFVGYVH
jgi:hypothetical protein